MTIIAVPAGLYFTDVEIWNDRVSSMMESPYTGKQQIQKLPYDAWGFSGGVVPYDRQKAGLLKSFVMKLAGRVNTFRLPIPGSKYPISAYVGVQGVVNGGNQIGTSILTNGWSNSLPLLAEGDHFNIGDELFVCTSAVSSSATGTATILFEPPMKIKPVNGTQITVRDPWLLLRSSRDDIARWKIIAPVRHAFSLDGIEAI